MIKLAKLNKYHYCLIASLLVVTVLTSCRAFYKDIRMTTLSLKQQQQVNALLDNSPTRCIGAYLIDLPAEFKVNKEGYFNYKSNHNITITTRQQYLPPFKQMIVLREQELRSTNPVRPVDGNYLKQVHTVHTSHPEKMQGIIFERMVSVGTRDVLRMLEGYRWQDEVTLKIEMKARNGLGQQYDEDRKDDPDSYKNNVPEKLAEMQKLFQRIKPRDDLSIPTEPGFCLLHGFMQGEDCEWKDMGFTYRHNAIDDFYFRITSNDFAGDYALLDKPEGYVTQGKGHTIYKGTRESNGLQLEEWIAKGQLFYKSDNLGYTFVLGIHMTDPTYKTPQLRIRMNYKIPDDETQAYSEEQLMVIWREVTSSIKLRESALGNQEFN